MREDEDKKKCGVLAKYLISKNLPDYTTVTIKRLARFMKTELGVKRYPSMVAHIWSREWRHIQTTKSCLKERGQTTTGIIRGIASRGRHATHRVLRITSPTYRMIDNRRQKRKKRRESLRARRQRGGRPE